MSTLLEQLAPPQNRDTLTRRFHVRMAYASAIVLIGSFAGCEFTSIRVTGMGGHAAALLLAWAMWLPLPCYWSEKHRPALRDAVLTIPWALLFAVILPFPVLIAARLHMPLQDSLFAAVDRSLGVSVPAIMAWANHHWLGSMANESYGLIPAFLPAAFLAPALAGKPRHAQEFLLGNLIAFAIGIPLFAFLPAVGPWYRSHYTGNGAQMYCQAQLLALRVPGTYIFHFQAAGVVCFPSFHVIWAILCAAALWGFRWLRIPVAVLAGMIILSTMTTGWHYFSDVLAGVVLAGFSVFLAKACTQFDLRFQRIEATTEGQIKRMGPK